MFEEKNNPQQPPQNLPTQRDRFEEEKELFGETEKTSALGSTKPPLTIPKEFLTKKKKFPILLILVIIVLIAGVVVLAQSSIFKLSPKKPVVPSATPTNQPALPTPVPTPSAINQIIDTDGDGLTDEQEASLGTNIQSTDSDNDGLFDFEEVKIYKTDPLNADTDSDGYKDGEEVKAGYSPKDATPGAKLLDLMKKIEKEKIP